MDQMDLHNAKRRIEERRMYRTDIRSEQCIEILPGFINLRWNSTSTAGAMKLQTGFINIHGCERMRIYRRILKFLRPEPIAVFFLSCGALNKD